MFSTNFFGKRAFRAAGSRRAVPILHARATMSFMENLTPQLVVAKAWQWLEVNGWYLVGALACWYLVLRPNLVDPALRAVAAPSAELCACWRRGSAPRGCGKEGRAPSV